MDREPGRTARAHAVVRRLDADLPSAPVTAATRYLDHVADELDRRGVGVSLVEVDCTGPLVGRLVLDPPPGAPVQVTPQWSPMTGWSAARRLPGDRLPTWRHLGGPAIPALWIAADFLRRCQAIAPPARVAGSSRPGIGSGRTGTPVGTPWIPFGTRSKRYS
ncbi:hypothetical protein [Actinokineospora enzanensis]|uniref:hypothetical protein n=1 Tax=Actinokineospora enzanensis TaxID=155975 RepID=UPI00036C0716|nr:hypothetical protein [Actinokineospora enzanensis]